MSDTGWSDGLVEGGFGDPATARLVGWVDRVQRMVQVEGALARALHRKGHISAEAAEAIVRACDPSQLDLVALAERAAVSATPLIPLLDALRREAGGDADLLHHGATSQDIVDTAIVLQVRDALGRLEDELLAVASRCAALAGRHRDDLVVGRTLGQHAVPTTFGLTAARWLGALDRRVEHLRWIRQRVLVVQLGGAAGTLGLYGDTGVQVAEALAEELDLGCPDLPWHAERDRIVELAGSLAATAATVGKIATDLVLLGSSEIDEVREGVSDGADSSAMPHKRNPVHATAARAAANLALGETGVLSLAASQHEHERAAGAWQAEWVALPSALVRTAGAVVRLRLALENATFDPVRARRNFDFQFGTTGSAALAAALVVPLGRDRATRAAASVASRALAERRPLFDVAKEDDGIAGVLSSSTLASVLDPLASLGSVDQLVDRALATHRMVAGHGSAAP